MVPSFIVHISITPIIYQFYLNNFVIYNQYNNIIQIESIISCDGHIYPTQQTCI